MDDLVFRTKQEPTEQLDAVEEEKPIAKKEGGAVIDIDKSKLPITAWAIATLTVNTWYRCRLEVNSDATQVNFYVYNDSGTLLGSQSITTNIPKTTGRETGAGVIATNSGTTATLLAYFDYMAVGVINRNLTR